MKGYHQGGQKNPVDFVLNLCCIVQLSSAWGGGWWSCFETGSFSHFICKEVQKFLYTSFFNPTRA